MKQYFFHDKRNNFCPIRTWQNTENMKPVIGIRQFESSVYVNIIQSKQYRDNCS